MYLDWLHSGSGPLTPTGTLKRIGHPDLITLIAEAWDTGFTNDLIMRAFQKGGLGLALDGTEDDMVWEGQRDELFAAHLQAPVREPTATRTRTGTRQAAEALTQAHTTDTRASLARRVNGRAASQASQDRASSSWQT